MARNRCVLRRQPKPHRSPSEWESIDWSMHTHDFEASATRLRYCDFGTGLVLILLHGMACSWQWWLECLPALGKTFRVIAVDLPGFGNSQPLSEPAELAAYADVVGELADELALGEVAVAGHSMGGLVALALTQRRPDLVSQLVLVDAGGVPMSERRLRIVLRVLRFFHGILTRTWVLNLLVKRPRLRQLMLRGAMRDPSVMSDALASVVVPLLAAPAFGDAIRASATAVRESNPESIRVPTTLIWGERDLFAPVQNARDMLARLPDGRLEVLAGLGHSPMVEAPHEFTELLVQAAAGQPVARHEAEGA